MLEKPSPFSLTETKSTTSALFSHWKNQSSLCYSFEMVYFPCSKNPPDFLYNTEPVETGSTLQGAT